MTNLILLRHAKSSWKYPELSDSERPLNKRGENDAPIMGKWLRENCPKPDIILTSTSVRTLATISRVGKELGIKGNDYTTMHQLYHASISELWRIVRSIDSAVETAMLVGHNPGLTELANELCPGESVDNIPTCGVFAVRFNCDNWEDVGEENAEFLFFQYPKNL